MGIGVGVNALLSKSLGEGNREKVNHTAGNGILLTAIAVVVFMLFGIFGSHPYYAMQSDVAETVEGGAAYTAICCIFTLGIFVEILGEKLLQASGRTAFTLLTQGLGAVTNILLDPLFIFGFAPLGIPAMGMAGAAIATVIGQWLAAIMAVILNLKCNPDVQFAVKYLKMKKEAMKPILTVGIPSVVMVAIGSVMNFSMNQILQSFPGETATGVFGIYFKLQSFVFMPVFGLNNASISIIAYNYGARQPRRISACLKWSVGAVMSIMLLGTLLFQLFPELLLGIFQPSEDFLALGISALRIISTIFPLAAIGIALGASFQGLGNGIYSTITSLCRQLIVLLPAAFLLSLSGDVHLVWWAFPISEVVSLAVTLFLFLRIYRLKIKPLY